MGNLKKNEPRGWHWKIGAYIMVCDERGVGVDMERDLYNSIRELIKDIKKQLGNDNPVAKFVTAAVVDYVLRSPSPTERDAIVEATARAGTFFDDLVAGDYERVMNELHRADPPGAV